MIRIILIAALIAGASSAPAQPVRIWEAQVEHPDPNVSPKPAFAGIMEGLPGADLQFVRKTGRFTIATELGFEIPWLEGVLTDAGFTLVGLWLDGMDLFADPVEESPAELLAPMSGSNLVQPLNNSSDEGQ